MKHSVFVIIILFLKFISPSIILAQDSLNIDTIQTKKKSNWLFLPAISYAPETKWTLGGVVDRYFRLGDENNTRESYLRFLGIYTTSKQTLLILNWNIFTTNDNYLLRGEAYFEKYPDRFYGVGLDDITQYLMDDNGNVESFPFIFFQSNRYGFEMKGLRKIKPNFYIGLQFLFEKNYNLNYNNDSISIHENGFTLPYFLPLNHLLGNISGPGISMLYDDRPYANPVKGNFLQLDFWVFNGVFGSNSNLSTLELDARKYINTHKDQSLALRFSASQRWATNKEIIHMRALGQMGGKDFMRGLFEGTFQDRNILAFQTEYRLPLWHNPQEPLRKFWRHLGIVAFGNYAHSYRDWNQFIDGGQSAFTAGTGLRFTISHDNRVNIRIDYALSLIKGKDGSAKGQSGIYFSLGEAF